MRQEIKRAIILAFLIIVAVLTATICFAPIANEKIENKYANILFAGDLMFDRGIRYYANKNQGNEFIFSAQGGPASGWKTLSDFLKSQNLVVVNLEGPITGNKSVSSGTIPGSANNYTFTFDPLVAQTLFNQNIKLVNLGNNHILNFGRNGVLQTKEYLQEAKVDYFGEPDGRRSFLKDLYGLKIGFVAYNQFSGDTQEQEKTISEIKKVIATSNVIIVFCHWGDEYQTTSNAFQQELAHGFIDAGADLVIGSHPHVVQQMEVYNGKRIYYSLGNFVFDQYFEESVRNGLAVIVKINLKTKQLDFEEKKLYLQTGGQTIIKD